MMSRYRKAGIGLSFTAAVLLFFPTIISAEEAMSPGPYKAPLKYAIKLPKYCWQQYFGRTEPQYKLPPRNLCGVGINHFCPGVLLVIQAREEIDQNKKKRLLKGAEKEILYTKRWIADYPRCPLHAPVEKILTFIKTQT